MCGVCKREGADCLRVCMCVCERDSERGRPFRTPNLPSSLFYMVSLSSIDLPRRSAGGRSPCGGTGSAAGTASRCSSARLSSRCRRPHTGVTTVTAATASTACTEPSTCNRLQTTLILCALIRRVLTAACDRRCAAERAVAAPGPAKWRR